MSNLENKCHAACQGFFAAMKKFTASILTATSLTFAAHAADHDSIDTDVEKSRTRETYVEAYDHAKAKSDFSVNRRESPCKPEPVLKNSPNGTYVAVEVPPDCPGDIIKKGTC